MKSRGSVLVATATLVVAAFGCQFIVGSEPPPFACEDGKSGACPTGQTCSGGQCVTTSIAVDSEVPPLPDGEVPDTLVPPRDAGRDAPDGGPAPHGSACRLDKDCASNMCGTEGLLGLAVQATGSVCTSLCCTSAQCPSGFVCLAPGTGGNYCVAATALPERQLPPSGGAAGGATCTTNTECRSGLCSDPNDGGVRRCIDNCCKAADCTAGTCAVATVGGKYTGFVCTEPRGNFNVGTLCAVSTSCKTNLCYEGTTCRQRCCASSQCGAGNSCIWTFSADTPGTVLDFCFATQSRKPAGQTCVDFNDCASTQCEPETNGQPDGSAGKKVCRDLCCIDSDCPANERCLAAPDQPRVLRCVPR